MKDNSTKKKTVYAYLHTHWDREWYREFEEFKIRLSEVVDDVLNKFDANEIDSFYFDGQTAALEDYLQLNPEKVEKIKDLIRNEKLFIGPYYCSTDSFLVDAESLIKNLQLGFEYSKKLGNKKFLAYHSDTFGHSSYLPNIIKSFGIEHAIFWRGLGNCPAEFLFKNLKSIYLIEGYFHDYFSSDVTIERKVEMLKKTLDRISTFSSENILLPIGADHEATPNKIKNQIKEVNELLDDYEIVLSSPFEYLEKVSTNFKQEFNGEFRDCTRNFILPGVLSSRIDLKQKNARCQWALSRKLQVFHALIFAIGRTQGWQNGIDALYKLLLQNHAHDSIYGCSVDAVHRENNLRYDKILQGINAISNTIKRDLYVQDLYSVLNLGDFAYSGSVQFLSERKLPKEFNAQLISKSKGFPLMNVYKLNTAPITEDYTTLYEYLVDVKDVQSYSCTRLCDCCVNTNSSLQVCDDVLENNFVRFEVCKNTFNLIDKINNKKYLNFFEIIDRKDDGDSYNFGPVKGDKKLVAKFLGSKIKTKGHIKSTLQLDFKIQNQKIKVYVSLENQNDYLEFNVDYTNKTKNHLLQVEFSLQEKIAKTISDDLCGYTERMFDYDYDIYKKIPAARGVELKHNTAPMQKFLNVDGFCLITDGLPEYEVYKNKLRLTLLRCTGIISNPKNASRGTPAGPPLPTPELQMQGKQKARFAVCLGKTCEEMENNVQKFYGLVDLIQSDISFDQLFDTSNKNLTLSTAKLNKNNDLVLRFVNKSDKVQNLKFKTILPYKKILVLDMEENVIGEYTDRSVEANMFVNLLLIQN